MIQDTATNKNAVVEASKVADKKQRIASFREEEQKEKVEQWLNKNVERKISERLRNDPSFKRQRIKSEKDAVYEEKNEQKELQRSVSKDVVDERKMKVEKWLSANNLENNQNEKIRRLSEREKGAAVTAELSKSVNSVQKEQKTREFDVKQKPSLLQIDDEKIRNVKKFYNRSSSKEPPPSAEKKIKLEKKSSMNQSAGAARRPTSSLDVDTSVSFVANETSINKAVETENVKGKLFENSSAPVKRSMSSAKKTEEINNVSIKKESPGVVRTPSKLVTPKEALKEEAVKIHRTPSRLVKEEETNKTSQIPEVAIVSVQRSPSKLVAKADEKETTKTSQDIILASPLVDECIQTNQVNLAFEIIEPVKAENQRESFAESNPESSRDKAVTTPQDGTSNNTADRDSRELIKESKSIEESKDEKNNEEIHKKTLSSTLNSAKQLILQNWLQDYRKMASKSPLLSKRYKVKHDLDELKIDEIDGVTDTNKNKTGHKKRKKYSKKELELRRQKSKRYQQKLIIVSIVIVILSVAILATTLGLLLKFLVIDKKTTTTTSPCLNLCLAGYNGTYADGKCTCYDINECLTPLLNNCTGFAMTCQNSIGSYSCGCNLGYEFLSQNFTCVDINECDTDVCNLPLTAGCLNSPGSYDCVCKSGFKWDASLNSCVDINECLGADGYSSSFICTNNRTCYNTIGSYSCNCEVGYNVVSERDQISCVEIDECKLNSALYKCPFPYTCSNLDGTYACCRPDSPTNNEKVCQTCGLQYTSPLARIINGNTTIKNSWPWMVSIGINYKYSFYSPLFQAEVIQWINITHLCGGVLISNRYVLTAAHCFYKLSIKTLFDEQILIKPNQYHGTFESILTVYAGIQNQMIDKLEPNNVFKVEKIYIHENYDSMNYLNDIALIRLETQIPKTVKTDWVCMQDTYKEDFKPLDSKVYATGFGVTSTKSNDLANELQQVDLYVYPFVYCKTTTVTVLTDAASQICAGNLGSGKDTCSGDSGSPLVYNYMGIWYVIGIVSYGKGCATNDYPGVYTNVTYYMDWIKTKVF